MRNHNLKLKIVSFALLLGAVFSFSCFISISAAELVDINNASLTQLDTLTGIGPALAQRIIDSRPYSSLDDLLKVKGIGPKNLEKIKTQDLACVNCQTLQSPQTLTQNQTTSAPATNTIATTPSVSSTTATSAAAITVEKVVANTIAVPAATVVYPKNVLINEILPAPEGADEQNEWLEIYNGNDFEVDMAGWQIKDQVGAIKTYTWPADSPLMAKGFLAINRAQSKIVLQNNGDGLTLTNPQGAIADQITYPASPANQSYNRTSSGWIWSRALTPGQPNEIDKINTAIQQKISQKKPAAVSATSATSSNSLAAMPLIAQINQFSPSTSKLPRIFTFLLGLVVAIASAITVVFLRKKQKENMRF